MTRPTRGSSKPQLWFAADRRHSGDAVQHVDHRVRRTLSAGLQWYWGADFFKEITDEAIEIHRAFGERLPTGHSTMHLYPIDGAAARVPSSATAPSIGGWSPVRARSPKARWISMASVGDF